MKSIITLGVLITAVHGAVSGDAVKGLPGLDHLTSNLFSGYIEANANGQHFFTASTIIDFST